MASTSATGRNDGSGLATGRRQLASSTPMPRPKVDREVDVGSDPEGKETLSPDCVFAILTMSLLVFFAMSISSLDSVRAGKCWIGGSKDMIIGARTDR